MYKEPLDLFNAALAAIDGEDWLGLARMCDPVSLRIFQQRYLNHLDQAASRTLTADDYLRQSPDMPVEVAEYYASQADRFGGPERLFREGFPTIRSRKELDALTPEGFLAAWLLGHSPRVQLEREIQEGRLPDRAAARIRESLTEPRARPVVLGVLPDGAGLAHVVYRSPAPDADSSTGRSEEQRFEREVLQKRYVQVETLRRGQDGGWHLIAEYHLLGLGHNMFFVLADEVDEA